MDAKGCIEAAAAAAENGDKLLAAHIAEYGRVEPHIFVPDMLLFPLIEAAGKAMRHSAESSLPHRKALGGGR